MRLVFAVVCSLIASPVLAQQTTPAPATAPAAAPAPAKPICRRVQVTGSNMGKRECHTAAEWRAIDSHEDPSASRALQNRPMGG